MAASQNGWRANDASVVSRRTVPGTAVGLTVRNGSPGEVLLYVAWRFDREVEDIDNARGALDDWGYAERPIRGGTQLSNHASGTAIDLNSTRHPLGTDPRANFSAAQIAAIHNILKATTTLRGVQLVRWGGDYVGRKDPMHFEINDGVTLAQLDEMWRVLQAKPLTGQPAATTEWQGGTGGVPLFQWGPVVKAAAGSRTVGLGSRGTIDVPAVQRWHGVDDDGWFGADTYRKVRETQQRNGLAVDGIVGPATWKVMGFGR